MWLGDVPEHWHTCSLKRVVKLQSGDSITGESIEEQGAYPVYGGNGSRGYTTSFTHEGYFALIGRQGALCGNVNYANGKFWASEHAVVVTPIKPVSTVWLGELLRTMNLNQYSVAAAQPGLSVDIISNLRIPLPSLEEQYCIATFLGRETSKIDALISAQETLITLLAEKRQATISHAVTKGLNPNTPMKDSGVEWLGKVPMHWTTNRIKHLLSSFEQGWSPQCEGFPVQSEGDWGVLKVGCVNGGFFRPEENKALPIELAPLPYLGIAKGDLLISRANTRELVGSAAVALQDYANLMLCDKLFRVRFVADVCEPMFVAHYLGTEMARSQIELAASGASSSMVNIGQSTILELEVPLPTLLEQQEIIKFLNNENALLDALTVEAERGIALLKERRSALISAAVTGKIDVRKTAQQESSTLQEAA